MSDASLELDSARAILTTYRTVHDAPHGIQRVLRLKSHKKNKILESELNLLREKYRVLQQELIKRDKKLAELHEQLIDKVSYATRLQEDFENAIYQLTPRKE